MHDPALALVILAAAGGPLAPRRALLDAAPDLPGALADPALWKACGITAAQAAVMRDPPAALIEHARAWLAVAGHRVVGWNDPDYPPALRDAPSPPLALFLAGDPALLWRPSVAVVGTRGPTPAGREHARDFATTFAQSGLVVGSGLAAGIDAAAHQAVLEAGGATFAVLGTGPDVVYPRANAGLYARIEAQGLLVSEHPPGTGPRREHFPSRNRLLAALCLGTVVVEAAERSGALITARLAADAGREVFAIPGSIRNPLARGCHRLIRDGAALVESAEEVLQALGPLAAREAAQTQLALQVPPAPAPAPARIAQAVSADWAEGDPDHQIVWRSIGYDPTDMDELVDRTGLTASRLSSMLLGMELEGRVAQQHGRFYRTG